MAKVKDPVINRLRPIVADLLAVDEDEITPDASFSRDLHADSLDTVELVIALEESFEIEISDEEAGNIEFVKDVVALIEKKEQ